MKLTDDIDRYGRDIEVYSLRSLVNGRHELDRVSDRTEIMFNLAKKLLNTATDNTEKAMQLLHN
ncbi:hypothetical protein [Alkalibacterium gilvum]|uniref:hypothetical protein n=1 Tax=Alkalibacterium gilvum TaxID=1130080 RepID=UPI003F920568